MGIIYVARNVVNGKGYTGFTFDLERRKAGHKRDAENGSMLAFHCAIRKYGWDAFEWSVVYEDDEESDREWMGWWEKRFIRELGTKIPNGYNMTDGGDGGAMEFSDESREKIGNASREYWSDEKNRKKQSFTLSGLPKPAGFGEKVSKAQKGREPSLETRAKMSAAKKGKPGPKHSGETKKMMSEKCKGRPFPPGALEKALATLAISPNRGMTGKKHSEETKAKISEKHAGKKLSEETKKKIKASTIGHTVSEETRKKISETQKGKPCPGRGRKPKPVSSG